MYKKIANIDNVKTCVGNENDIYYVLNDNSFCSTGQPKTLCIDKSISRLLEFDNEILLLDINNNLINKPNSKIKFDKRILRTQNKTILFYIKTKPNRTYGIFDGLDIIYSSDKIGGNFNYLNNQIIDFNSKVLLVQNINQDLIWSFPLHLLGKPKYEGPVDQIEKLIGIANNNIWFNTKGGRLIILDMSTGKIIEKYSTHEDDLKLGYKSTLNGTNVYLNTNENYIYGMSADFVQKIDTLSCKIIDSYNFRENDPEGMGTYEYVYAPLLKGEYFTFLGEKKHTDGIRFIGLFDYNERKLVWEYELISKAEFLNGNKLIIPEPVLLSGDKIYVKDFNSTLHILEKN